MSDDKALTLEDVAALSSSTGTAIDGDKIWIFLGQLGRYQMFQTFLMILGGLGFATAIIGVVFTGQSVDFTCVPRNDTTYLNITTKTSSCTFQYVDNSSLASRTQTCDSHHFEGGDKAASYLADWDLVCDREAVGQLPQTMAMVGMMIGSSLLPPVADQFGRKRLVLVSQFLSFIVIGAMAFVRNFEIFLFLKLLSGAFNQSNMIGLMTCLIEMYTTSMRSAVSFIHNSMWLLSVILLVPCAYFLRLDGWRSLQTAYAFFSVFVIFHAWFFDESVRWLLANGRYKQAEAVLKKACRMNGKKYTDLLESMRSDIVEEKKLSEQKVRTADTTQSSLGWRTILLIMKSKYLRKVTFISCYVWMVNSMTYYGLILLSSSLPGDVYINFIIITLLEMVSAGVMWFSMQRYGRRRPLMVFMLGATVFLLASVLVANLSPSDYDYSTVLTVLTQLGKFCITVSFSIIWIYTPELYPTNLRNIGTGISATASRTTTIATPFFNILARRALWAPGAVFGACCLVAVILITLIPETRWEELPQNIEDVEAFFKKGKLEKKKNGKPWKSMCTGKSSHSAVV